jgi:hypothetical protein
VVSRAFSFILDTKLFTILAMKSHQMGLKDHLFKAYEFAKTWAIRTIDCFDAPLPTEGGGAQVRKLIR